VGITYLGRIVPRLPSAVNYVCQGYCGVLGVHALLGRLIRRGEMAFATIAGGTNG
jgi:hypothetical protein